MGVSKPERSTIASGSAGLIAWAICALVKWKFGVVLSEGTVVLGVVALMTVVTHVVPDGEIIKKKLDDVASDIADFIPQVDFTYPEEKMEWNPNNLSKK